MRSWRILAIFGVCLWPMTGRAGLYNPAEPGEVPHRDFAVFHELLKTLGSIGVPDDAPFDSPLRQRYALAAQIKEVPASWGVTRRLSLSGYWIRRQPAAAVDLLHTLRNADPRNFVVHANLAMAFYREPEFARDGSHFLLALRSVEDALRFWPKQWDPESPESPDELVKQDYQRLARAAAWSAGLGVPLGPTLGCLDYEQKIPNRQLWLKKTMGWNRVMDWNKDLYEHYRESEVYFRKFLTLRHHEFQKNVSETSKSVDGLFGPAKAPVRFVGESGKFEPGKIAQKERDKLPADAVKIVQQLLIWMPEMPQEPRLYWLLGELYNAEGNIAAARQIFRELGAGQSLENLQKGPYGNPHYAPKEFREHYEALEKHPTPAVKVPDAPPPPPPPTGPRGMDWNSLLIGFGAGVVAVLFVLFQVLEIRRRRLKRAAMMRGTVHPGGAPAAGTNSPAKESHPGKVAT